MRHARTAVVALVLAILLSGSGHARKLPPDVLDHLQRMHHHTQTVSGSFTQEKRLALFEQILVSRGTFAIAKPKKIHWAYQEPTAFGFASDGVQVRRWNEQFGMSKPMPLGLDPVLSMIVEQMLAWSTMDTHALESFFSLSLADADPITLHLEPKTSQVAEIIKQVRITFASDGTHIQEIRIMELDDDETRIRFENVRINQELPHRLF